MNPIRILHVVTYMGRGGLETMIMNYYRHIDRSKVQFDFLVHREPRADFDDEIEALGGRIYRFPRLVPWSRSYNAALDHFFAAHREYRVVHVHQDCLSAVILKTAQKHGVPVRIAHSHNNNQEKNLKYLIKLYYMRQIPGSATDLFACGREAGDWMFRGAPYRILNNAIDAQKYAFSPEVRKQMRGELGIDEDTLLIGNVARFYQQKNHTFLLEIFAQLKRIRPKARLLLVGEGPLHDELRAKVKTLGIVEDVIFAGVRTDVHALLQAMDVFLFPSLFEGLPVTLIEAQAAGLPCLISDTISDECRKTDMITFFPLSRSPAEWAGEALRQAGKARTNTLAQIQQSGFDIRENAAFLQNFYLEKYQAE